MSTNAQADTNVRAVWPRDDYTRVPYSLFLDRDVFEQEQVRVFRGPVWCYLALEAEIPRPGDFKTTVVGDTPVVVNRDATGAIHAFVNRCAHRGASAPLRSAGAAPRVRCRTPPRAAAAPAPRRSRRPA